LGRSIAGKFVIDAFIGSGAMGAVYRARQTALEKVVAVKVLHRELAKDQTFPVRFMREAKAASRIDHPNSMRVLDFGEEPDGTLYMAMEFLDGRDLFHVIQKEWPISPQRSADLLMQTLAALAVAHEMGVVHRDLKPENIMVLTVPDDEGGTKDHVKVCDFGIAKITDKRSDLTQTEGPKLTTQGLVVGTPEYMSPEQGRGEALDARADLYSIGIILYQLLVGHVPFEAESALGVVLKHVTDDPVRPSERAPGIDPRLEAICMKAIRKSPADRYQSAREMRSDLRAVLHGSMPAPMHPDMPVPLSVPLKTPAQLAVAATEVSLDSAAVRAAAHRSSSKLTPPGTNIESLAPPPMTGRFTGHIVAAVLLVGVMIGGAVIFRDRLFAAKAVPSKDAVAAPPVVSAPPKASEPAPVVTAPAQTSAAPSTMAPVASGSGKAGGKTPAPHHSASAAASAAPKVPAAVTDDAGVASPAGPFDAARAKVTIGAVHVTGTAIASVRHEIDAAALTACYRSGLEGVTSKPPVSKMVLHLATDDAGKVSNATLRGGPPIPQKAGDCVMQSMIGKTIRGQGDTGPVSADVDLAFATE
jgi:serine/threonine protein kinase